MKKTVGKITVILPDEFQEAEAKTDEMQSPIPGGDSSIEHFFSFKGPADKELNVFYWEGRPLRDYGTFMGQEQEVFCCHGNLEEKDYFLIYSPNLTFAEFKVVLENIEFCWIMALIEKALEIYKKSNLNNSAEIAKTYNNLAEINKELGEYTKALELLNKTLKLKGLPFMVLK